MNQQNQPVPSFVWITLIILGIIDLIRGFMHTILLEYSALNIAGLNLDTSTAADQLQLLGVFGISNWITGILFILIGLKARYLSLYVLGLIPVAYGLSIVAIRINSSGYTETTSDWGGLLLMVPYLTICAIVWIAGVVVMKREGKE